MHAHLDTPGLLQAESQGRAPHAESSAQAISRAARLAEPKETTFCVSCLEHHATRNTARGSRNCAYYATCVSELIRHAIHDEALFPPRCYGQQILVTDICRILDPSLISELQRKSVEHNTADLTYCHDPSCSTFIPPTSINVKTATGQCSACRKRTCTMCKAAMHPGEYPRDTGLQQLRKTATAAGWRECRCGCVIELNRGCNHITYVLH